MTRLRGEAEPTPRPPEAPVRGEILRRFSSSAISPQLCRSAQRGFRWVVQEQLEGLGFTAPPAQGGRLPPPFPLRLAGYRRPEPDPYWARFLVLADCGGDLRREDLQAVN